MDATKVLTALFGLAVVVGVVTMTVQSPSQVNTVLYSVATGVSGAVKAGEGR